MKRKNGNGSEDTETTVEDLLREISTKLDKLDAIDHKLDNALMRDRQFEARVAKLETRMTKLEKKRA